MRRGRIIVCLLFVPMFVLMAIGVIVIVSGSLVRSVGYLLYLDRRSARNEIINLKYLL